MVPACDYDEIGYWSEVKLDIIRKYAAAYSSILYNQKSPCFHHCYIDAFAGAGTHVSKSSGAYIDGSPTNALKIEPPFKEYFFIDLNKMKVESLEQIAEGRSDVHIYHGDCNKVLLDQILPKVSYENYKRGLCLLDPYGLHLDWEVLFEIGQMKSVEIFLNFPVCDMNRNVLWRKPEKVSEERVERMNKFWGDDSWRKVAYKESKQMSLFGDKEIEKESNDVIAEAFRRRLIEVAGFEKVPTPIAMRNSHNAIVYYLFFASQKPVAGKIVKDIFSKYESRQGV